MSKPDLDEESSEPIIALAESGCDDMIKTFNKRIDEMDLSHIDSSESPSEETSPPNQSTSPPPIQIPEETPKLIHKSFTESFLRVKEGSKVSRSLTEINGDYLRVDASFYGKYFKFKFPNI